MRRFKTVPSRKLGSQFVLRRVGAGTRTWDNTIVMGQGSNSASHRSSRVSLRRPGRVVCSRGWAVPLTNLFLSSVVVRECSVYSVNYTEPSCTKKCEQSPVTQTRILVSHRGLKMIQPSLTACTGLLGIGIDTRTHCNRIPGRGPDRF